ncbi:MAG: DUF429 domain-containing protein [Anaerolineales bacterium]|nr:DUF429 domain-containing protein [Anaerolineales bacterium]
MNPIYVGVDVAGKENTWIAGLSPVDGNLKMIFRPHRASLCEIMAYCEQNDVIAVAIDAQLTASISDENGFRSSDIELRQRLPADCRIWVASINSLMAVPARGMMLAEALGPVVGTILETHPRVGLLFGLGESAGQEIRKYKKRGPSQKEYLAYLLDDWCKRFHISNFAETSLADGALDSLVCATVAYLFHHSPESLLRLRQSARDCKGRGPFYVIAPGLEKSS